MECHPTNKAIPNPCGKCFEEGEAGKHNQLDYQAPDGEKHRIPPASAMRPDTTN